MYAIVSTGGKQYKVAAGDTIEVEKIEGEAGTTVELPVLFLSNDGDIVVDADELAKAKVEATIVEQFKGKKQVVFKFKKRKGYKKKQGHRQNLTRLQIASIADAAGNAVTA